MLTHSLHTCQGRFSHSRSTEHAVHIRPSQSSRFALHTSAAHSTKAAALHDRQASGTLCSTSPRCSSQSVKASRSDVLVVQTVGWQKLARQGLALSLALLALGSAPKVAALETVAPSEALAKARPLPQNPKVDKGRVWLLFVGGAVTLFGGTVLLERFEGLFPAIAKANRVLSGQELPEEMQAPPEEMLQAVSDERLEAAVAAGLADARRQGNQGKLPETSSAATESDTARDSAAASQPSANGAAKDEAAIAPDSLEASETNAIEETYASTHQ